MDKIFQDEQRLLFILFGSILNHRVNPVEKECLNVLCFDLGVCANGNLGRLENLPYVYWKTNLVLNRHSAKCSHGLFIFHLHFDQLDARFGEGAFALVHQKQRAIAQGELGAFSLFQLLGQIHFL